MEESYTAHSEETEIGTERIVAFDVLKCFAIFLVLWAHGIQHLTSADCIENPLYRVIYSFHMPLFMMVSGYFSVKSMRLGFREFAKKKLRQIVLPGFLWPWVYVIIGMIAGEESVHLYSNPTRYIPFWFLWALLICNLLAYAGHSIKYGRILTLLVSQVIPFANVVFMYPAFIVGQLLYNNKEWFKRNIKVIIGVSALLYLVAMLFWGVDDWHLASQTQERIASSGYLAAGFFYVGKTAYKLVVNLSGSVMFISLFLFSDSLWDNQFCRVLGLIGKYTLIIYILQSFILEMQLPKYIHLDYLSQVVFDYIATPVIALVVILFSVGIAMLVDTNKYSRLLLLGR